MICKIADLIVDVPEVGGLTPHLQAYQYNSEAIPDITIQEGLYEPELYSARMSYDTMVYLESGRQFFTELVNHNGFYLHSSSVVYEGKAYLFSAPSGTGKSTHTRIWQNLFGETAKVFNDDKTPLRYLDGKWYAYGAPWCGKDNININMKVPLAGICFLKQDEENTIRRLSAGEAVIKIISQTIYKYGYAEHLDRLLVHIDRIVRDIPMFELKNRPEEEAAMLSYETMRRAAEEAGL